MGRLFDTKNVVVARISEDDLNSFTIDTDIDDNGQYRYMLEEFARAVMNTIPEYVFAHYEGPVIPITNATDKLREAAKAIYKIKEFELLRDYYFNNLSTPPSLVQLGGARGEFGEVILHMLLRDFKGTIPLVSKVYFKDAAGVPSHGFDLVHISENERILWLGESKFYSDCKKALRDLEADLEKHIKQDFLDEQFLIIKKNLEAHSCAGRDKWIQILSNCNTLRDRISMINIPLLCIYPNDVYRKFPDMRIAEAGQYHEINIRDMKAYFDSLYQVHPLKGLLNITLICFPIRDKIELAKLLHEKLWSMQNI